MGITPGNDRAKREEKYGQALARTLQAVPPDGSCLSCEEMDDLVEGRADVEKRKQALAHLATCECCLRSFGVASELSHEEKSGSRRRLWIGAPLAMAVVLLLALSMNLSRHNLSTPQVARNTETIPHPAVIPPHTSSPQVVASAPRTGPQEREANRKGKSVHSVEFAPALAALAALPLSNDALRSQSQRSMGYAAPETTEHNRFRAGAEIFSARLALARGDRGLAADLLRRAADKLSSGGKVASLARELTVLADELSTVVSTTVDSRLDTYLTPSGAVDPHIMLGAWCQGVTLAAKAAQGAFFTTDWFIFTGKALLGGSLEKETKQVVGEILTKSAQAKSEEDFEQLLDLVRRLK